MCLAIPSKIISINDMSAVVDVCGAQREVSLLLLPVEVHLEDYVLVHAGFAIQKVDNEAAAETLQLIKEMADAGYEE